MNPDFLPQQTKGIEKAKQHEGSPLSRRKVSTKQRHRPSEYHQAISDLHCQIDSQKWYLLIL